MAVKDEVMSGQAMLESFTIERSDIKSPHLKKRVEWMLQVMRFMRVRGWLSAKWITLSSRTLEANARLPSPWPDVETNLTLSDSLQDLYHSAAECKSTFDTFVKKMMKVAKPKVTREFQSW